MNVRICFFCNVIICFKNGDPGILRQFHGVIAMVT